MALALTLGVAPAAATESWPVGGSPWTGTPPAPLTPRTEAAAVAVDGKVLVFGGHGGGKRCPDAADCVSSPLSLPLDAALYDPALDLWRPVTPMPVGMWVQTATVSGGRVFAYGYANRVTDISAQRIGPPDRFTALAFDPLSGTWETLPAPPSPATWSETVQLLDAGGRLVALRTSRRSGPVGHTYDPTVRRWRPLPRDPLPTYSRSESGGPLVAAWVADRLYVGAAPAGRTAARGRLALAALDPRTGEWSRMRTLPVGGEAIAVAGRILFSRTGAYDPQTRHVRPLPSESDDMITGDYFSDVDHPIADGLVAGDRVTLDGYLWDPATGATQPLPVPPALGTREPASAALPGLLFRFGGSPDGRDKTSAAYVLRLAGRSR